MSESHNTKLPFGNIYLCILSRKVPICIHSGKNAGRKQNKTKAIAAMQQQHSFRVKERRVKKDLVSKPKRGEG